MMAMDLVLLSCSKDLYPKTVQIEYKVYSPLDSAGLVQVNFSNANFKEFTLNNVPLPFDSVLTRTVGKHNWASVEGIDDYGLALTAEIYINGVLVASDTASGISSVDASAAYQFK